MEPPTAFDFVAVLKRAKDEERVVLVNVFSSQSAPCQEMDRVTWSDPAIVARLAEAIVIRVDADAEPTSARLLIADSLPTIVAFDQGGEVARIEGPRTPAELLAWFDEIAIGKNFGERRRREVEAAPENTFRRIQLADSLIKDGALAEATAECVWLWKHMLEHEPKMAGIKHFPWVNTLKRLVAAHPPARDAFAALREASPPSLDVPDNELAFADWWALNKVLGEDAATLAWFDEHGDRALSTAWLAPSLRSHLEPLLIAADRWSDVARLYEDAIAAFREQATLRAKIHAETEMARAASPPGMPRDALGFGVYVADEQLRETAYKLVRALRAARRDDEAEQIAVDAAAADASAEMAAALEGRYTAPSVEEMKARWGG